MASSGSLVGLEHDLFGKPVSAFPDHALVAATMARLFDPEQQELLGA
jgi:hypothetical protein